MERIGEIRGKPAPSKGKAMRARILKSASKLIVERGYSGTTLDEILARTGVTKGAFFYHFKSKDDLARTLIEHFAQQVEEYFEDLFRQGDETTRDPMDSILFVLHKHEEFLSSRAQPYRCMFASFTHELPQFPAEIREIVRIGLDRWKAIFATRFQRLLSTKKPRQSVSADDLAAMYISVIEGGLILGQADNDLSIPIRQAQLFRNYIEMLFKDKPHAP
jgi:TetR/AcrR family transcriptional regulator, transcriptional repressor for nem operon